MGEITNEAIRIISELVFFFFLNNYSNLYSNYSNFVLVFFSPFSIAITSLGEERANLSAFSTFFRFVLVWICRFPLPLWVWEGLRFVIVALPGLFSYLFLGIQIYIYRDLYIKTIGHVLMVY